MRPKLKDTPGDWWKFMAGVCVAAAIVVLLLHRRRVIENPTMWWLLTLLAVFLIAGVIKPVWARPLYHVGMSITFYVGQVAGRILLTVLFLVVVIPLGIVLRLLGKDLLGLKRKTGATTYWQPVQTRSDLNRQF